MDAPRFTLICCSVDPAAAEALRRNVAATIGEPFEFDVWDNRGRNVGLCDVYDRCAERSGGEYLCFVHEDVRFLTEGWGARLAAKLCEPDCGVIGFAGSVLKLRRTTAWLHGVGDMRANYVQHHGGGRHLVGGFVIETAREEPHACLVFRERFAARIGREFQQRAPCQQRQRREDRGGFKRADSYSVHHVVYSFMP